MIRPSSYIICTLIFFLTYKSILKGFQCAIAPNTSGKQLPLQVVQIQITTDYCTIPLRTTYTGPPHLRYFFRGAFAGTHGRLLHRILPIPYTTFYMPFFSHTF
jgi:hypothetical protein